MSLMDTLKNLPIPVAVDYLRLKQWCIANDSHGVIAVDDSVLADMPREHLKVLHDAGFISVGFDDDFDIQLFAVEELLAERSPVGGLSFVAVDAREYITI